MANYTINKIKLPNGDICNIKEPILYSVSSQENNSDVIKATIPGFELTPGVVITLKIPNITNTGTKIEINNNSGQIKNIKYNNANIKSGFLLPNYFYSFVYAADDTWNLIGTITANDILDYDYEYFPNGFVNIGEVASLSSSGNATYTKNGSSATLADPGDLVYIIKKKDENGGNDPSNLLIEWYACYEENNLTQWLKLIPKSIGQSNKLITERTLYYYEGNENISKLGTITQGTWNGTPVDVEHGGTNNTSVTLNGILYGSSSTQISSKVPSWKNWITNAINGPKAVIQLGDMDYISDSIPAANTEISGIITTTNQSFLGTKTFVNNSLWLKNNSTNINKILFGANTLNDLINNYKINDTGVEWASINLRIPSIRNETTYNTQFSFRQLQISQTTSNEENETGLTIFSPGSNYEEYFLPVVDSVLTTNKNYDILTTKFTVTVPQGGTGNVSFLQNSVLYGNGNNAIQTIASANGALFATSTNGALQWGTLPIAQGGTGATTLFAAKANLGFGVAAHDFTLSNFLELDQHWGIGAVVQSAEVEEGEDDKDFLNKKTFLILTNSGLLSYNNTDDEKIWEFSINSSDITATVYNTPNETDSGISKASYKILYKSNDTNAVGSSTSPVYIDENGEVTACGGTLNVHASLDLPLTGGTLTNTLTVQTGGIWIQGGSNAGSNDTRMGLTSGMPDKFPYNQSKRGTYIYSNAIAFADPYNGNSGNDSGWLRHIEETANSGVLEIAVGDDGNESIVARQYNTSSAIVRTATLLDASGNTSFPGTTTTTNLYINGGNGAGIYYTGTQATYRMIRFLDNTGDIYGNGISIGGGGYTIIGSGESADTMVNNLGYTGGSEITVVASDGDIAFYPGNNSYDASTKLTMTASRFWAGVNGNTTREAQVGVQSGAGQIYLWSAASATGDRGIWIPAHGTGEAKYAISVNTNNVAFFQGGLTGPGVSGSTHAEALKAYFNSYKASEPRNALVAHYSSAHSNGSLCMGYFLNGYDSGPYGGFFVCHYNWPRYVGISNGTYTQHDLISDQNYTSYTVTKTGSGASGTWGISVTGNAANVTGTVAVGHGGTGATTAAGALSNLGACGLSGVWGTSLTHTFRSNCGWVFRNGYGYGIWLSGSNSIRVVHPNGTTVTNGRTSVKINTTTFARSGTSFTVTISDTNGSQSFIAIG